MDKVIKITIAIDHTTGERFSVSAPTNQTIHEFCENLDANHRVKAHLYLKPDDKHHLLAAKTFKELGIEDDITLYAKNFDSSTIETPEPIANGSQMTLRITDRAGRNQPVTLKLEEMVKISDAKNLYRRELGLARDSNFELFAKDSQFKIPEKQTLKEALGLHSSDIPTEIIELEVDNEQDTRLCKGCSIF